MLLWRAATTIIITTTANGNIKKNNNKKNYFAKWSDINKEHNGKGKQSKHKQWNWGFVLNIVCTRNGITVGRRYLSTLETLKRSNKNHRATTGKFAKVEGTELIMHWL